MSGPRIPPHAPSLMRQQAELTDLRWVAAQMVAQHDRRTQEASHGHCECPLCRHARRWVEKA